MHGIILVKRSHRAWYTEASQKESFFPPSFSGHDLKPAPSLHCFLSLTDASAVTCLTPGGHLVA